MVSARQVTAGTEAPPIFFDTPIYVCMNMIPHRNEFIPQTTLVCASWDPTAVITSIVAYHMRKNVT